MHWPAEMYCMGWAVNRYKACIMLVIMDYILYKLKGQMSCPQGHSLLAVKMLYVDSGWLYQLQTWWKVLSLMYIITLMALDWPVVVQ